MRYQLLKFRARNGIFYCPELDQGRKTPFLPGTSSLKPAGDVVVKLKCPLPLNYK